MKYLYLREKLAIMCVPECFSFASLALVPADPFDEAAADLPELLLGEATLENRQSILQ